MTGKHRQPTRRGMFVLGGGLALAPVSMALFLWKEQSGRQTPAAPEEAPAVPQPQTASTSAAVRPPGWMADAARMPIEVNFRPESRDGQRGLILHVQQGEGSLFERFSDPVTKSSSHFWVSRAGEIEQYVSVHDRAWTQKAGNAGWASIETSGFADRPLTAAQVEAVARVYVWGARLHGWPLEVTDSPEGRGLGTHSMGGGDWGGHACPGTIRARQRDAIMRRVRDSLRS
ncbi:peptidoglycan recognition family protein [Streptomyces sp. NPDC000594]|uniref:peptidoglycan recognition protein family protein n=1 Tax=Streptomyces sp. NPDC000594 TaxID=3154261 RepID=UPI00331C5228